MDTILTSLLLQFFGDFCNLLQDVGLAICQQGVRAGEAADDVVDRTHWCGSHGLACEAEHSQESLHVGEHAEQTGLVKPLEHDVVEAAGVVQQVPETVLQVQERLL